MAYDATSVPSPDKGRAQELMQRSERLFTAQRQHAMLWQSLAEIFYPERADFISQRSDGAERYEGLFDSEPQLMRRNLANNLGAMLRTRGKDWFFLRAADDAAMEDDGVKLWCEDSTKRLRNIIYANRSNFTSAMSESDNDYVTFGNAVLVHTYNRDGSGLLFRCAHLRDVAWTENEERVIDEVHEKMRLSLRQLARMFGPERLPEKVRQRLQKDQTEMVWVRRCVAPIDEYALRSSGGPTPPRDMRFASTYVLEEECAPLAETFFRTFPYLVRRWMTVSGEPYGRSPAAGVALADSRTLNVAQASILKSIEWAVDPPKVAVDDGVVGEIRLEAGGITYVDQDAWEPARGQPIRSLEAGNPQLGMEFVDRNHARLGRAWFQNLLTLPEREMTAYEAGERMEMYTREAAPIFEPMEAENGLLMEGVMERAMFKGAFDEPPEPLQGREVRFDFDTPLTSALKKYRAFQAQQAKAAIAASMQLDPTVIDNVDLDALTRDELEGVGPVKWLVPKEVVAERRQARAAAQQAAEEKADAMAAADLAARAKPETLAALENAMGGEVPEEEQAAPASGGMDWAALLAEQGAPAPEPAPAAPPQPDMATVLAQVLDRQGVQFAQALDRLGEKLTAPRVAVRDKDGKIVGSKVEGAG